MLSSQCISSERRPTCVFSSRPGGNSEQTACLSLISGPNLSEQSCRKSRLLIGNSHGHSMPHGRSYLAPGILSERTRLCRASKRIHRIRTESAANETPPLHVTKGGQAAASQQGGDIDFEEAVHSTGRAEEEFSRSESVAESLGEGEDSAGPSAEAGEDGKERGMALPFWLRYLQQWYPYRVRKHLQQLKERAEADSADAASQALYLHHLNIANRPRDVITWFDERSSISGGDAVVEYLKALVATDQISDYLPRTRKGDSLSLASLLQTLKVKANPSGGDSFPPPGISPNHPLHASITGSFARQSPVGVWGTLYRFLTLFLTVFMGCMVVAVGLRSYGNTVASSGGAPSAGVVGGGVAGTGSYAPKEYVKDVVAEKNVKTFKDVKGCDEAKAEVEEIVEYLKNPAKFTRLGGKLPKGVLLVGPPGNGKTLLAKAIAGEAGVPFFYRSGAEFEEMFVGVGARRVRALFQVAKKKAPCIVFIDEIDAIGGRRSRQWEGHSSKTLNQLLTEMDGFEDSEGVIVIAATNLPDSLDPALTRPGRFDRHVAVAVPDVRGRQQILALYFEGKPVSADVNLSTVARGTPGFSGAELANLVNEAAVAAAKEDSPDIATRHLEYAKDKILMGAERKSMVLTEEGRRLTAYHESGHAVTALFTGGANPIHKATIMPRGHALGYVSQLPAEDETSMSKEQMMAQLDVLMGGRVAEEMVFGLKKVTSGASSDLKKATSLARHMVCECGMSDEVGPLYVDERSDHVSAATRKRVDDGVMELLRGAYARVQALLGKHEGDLHKLAKQLLEQETMTAAQIIALLKDNGGKAIEEATRVEEMVAETSVDNVEGGDFDGAAS